MAYVPVLNQSVSGTVGASILGAPPANIFVGGALATTANPLPVQPPLSGFLPVTVVGSVISYSQGSVAAVIVGGSIAASFTPPANQSVSGTVQTDVRGSVATVIIGGSIAASFTPPANQSVSGTVHIDNFSSVIAYQLAGSVLATSATVNPAANQSVSGTVGASIIGHAPVVIVGGSIAASFTPPANQSVSGTVHIDNFSSVVSYQLAGSVLAISGSLTPAANQSVSGTVGAAQIGAWSASIGGTVSVLGTVPVTQATPEWTVKSSVAGGIFPISGSVAAVVTNFPTNQNVSGSVVAFQSAGWSGSVAATQAGTARVSVISSTPSSMLVGASIFGTAPVTQAGTWIASVFGNLSVLGTVPVTQSGTWAPSALSYYYRNDTLASTLGSDGSFGPASRDSAGRTIIKPFAAQESAIEGYVSLTSTSITTLVAAAGAGLKNYITDIIIANTGAATTLVTFSSGGGTSILGYTIAPTGGGSNIIGLQVPLRTLANETFGIQAATATSTLYATVKGYKAP